MAKKKINVMFVLDETGSMQSCIEPTISGFNEYVDTLRKDTKTNYVFSLLKFNNNRINVGEATPIKDVPELSRKNYNPDNTTPLYDAIARGISEMGNKKNVMVIIQTDGFENASMEYTQKDVFDMITEKTKKNWQFAFLGSNQDAWATGAQMGISRGQTMSYDPKQTGEVIAHAAIATMDYARNPTASSTLFPDTDIREKSTTK